LRVGRRDDKGQDGCVPDRKRPEQPDAESLEQWFECANSRTERTRVCAAMVAEQRDLSARCPKQPLDRRQSDTQFRRSELEGKAAHRRADLGTLSPGECRVTNRNL